MKSEKKKNNDGKGNVCRFHQGELSRHKSIRIKIQNKRQCNDVFSVYFKWSLVVKTFVSVNKYFVARIYINTCTCTFTYTGQWTFNISQTLVK